MPYLGYSLCDHLIVNLQRGQGRPYSLPENIGRLTNANLIVVAFKLIWPTSRNSTSSGAHLFHSHICSTATSSHIFNKLLACAHCFLINYKAFFIPQEAKKEEVGPDFLIGKHSSLPGLKLGINELRQEGVVADDVVYLQRSLFRKVVR